MSSSDGGGLPSSSCTSGGGGGMGSQDGAAGGSSCSRSEIGRSSQGSDFGEPPMSPLLRPLQGSEQLLNLTLYTHRVPSRRMPRLPFCLLVKRKCKCCLLVESCHRNGNKCRPCSAEEERAQRANASLEVPPQWPADASVRYDAVMPPAYAAVRQSISGLLRAKLGTEGFPRRRPIKQWAPG